MTAYTAVAAGEWDNVATWGGAGYPNSLSDTADLAGFAVTMTGITIQCGQVVLNGGSLTVYSGSILELGNTLSPALLVDAGSTLAWYGRIIGQTTGNNSRIQIVSTATLTETGIHTCKDIYFLPSKSLSISDLIGATTEADQATCDFNAFGGSTLTVDVSCAAYSLAGESSYLVFNAGVTVKVVGSIGNGTNGVIKVNGTMASPVVFQPYTPGATYLLRLFGHALSVVDWLTFSGATYSNLWDPGASYGFNFTRDPSSVTPIVRPPIIDTTQPLARKVSRTHYKGNEAAIIEIEGKWYVPGKQYDRVDYMMNNGTVVGFVNEDHQIALPGARIVAHEYKRVKGELYWPYVITLQEARD